MKKILLILTVAVSGFYANAQVSVKGISPVGIAVNYVFEWNDGADWTLAPDLTVPGTFVQGELALVDTGEPGTNAQNHPIAQEGCAPLINGASVAGRIAVIYRNTCEFGAKALNAQNAGAIAVIIVNRDNEVVGMGAGANGAAITIPVVMLSSLDGGSIVNAMLGGPVVMFIGSKFGLVTNDVGSLRENILIAKKGTNAKFMADASPAMEVGLELYNYGTSDNLVEVNAVITGPSGIVYDQTVGPILMDSFDTLYFLAGEPNFFPVYSPTSWAAGDYSITYTLSIPSSTDLDMTDNMFSSNFSISAPNATGGTVSYASSTAGQLDNSTYPSNATTSYKACMFYEEDFVAPNTGVEGFSFAPGIDTSVITNSLVGEDIYLEVWEWNDPWVVATDPATPLTYAALNQVGFGTYTATTDANNGQTVYQALSSPVTLVDGQRYLMCLQAFNPEVYFGADNIDYSFNFRYYEMPICPINIDDTWFALGWNGAAVSLGLKLASNLGIEETAKVQGNAYPNPTTNNVTVSVAAKGNAQLRVTDVSGKTAYSGSLDLNTGKADVNISNLESGMYIFNVQFENGQSSQFNVVKN